jgi:hypothetical protein
MKPDESHHSDNKRRSPRFNVNFHARWEGEWAEREGMITDLSGGGCFVLTGELVKLGELVRIELRLPRQGHITLWGHVVHHEEERGFAVRFAPFLDEESRRKLEWLLKAVGHDAVEKHGGQA